MAKNYMQDVANILGVELGEEFKIDRSDTICKFFENGLFLQCCGTWLRAEEQHYCYNCGAKMDEVAEDEVRQNK